MKHIFVLRIFQAVNPLYLFFFFPPLCHILFQLLCFLPYRIFFSNTINFSYILLPLPRPTELDALVFGHLFTLLTTPLPDNRLATIVRSFGNLVKLCQVVERDFFEKNNGGSSSGNGEGDYDKLEDLNQVPM